MNLTDEQVETAAKMMEEIRFQYSCKNNVRMLRVCDETSAMFRDFARVAASFLQVPWSRPSDDEIKSACAAFARTENRNSTWIGVPFPPMSNALEAFVVLRNAALLPKPVDPRRDKILRVMERELFTVGHNTGQAVDAILAALDAKE